MKNFKKITLLFVSLLALSACDNEPLDGDFGNNTGETGGGGGSANPADLIGDWEIVSFEATTANEIDMMGQVFSTGFEVEGVEMDYIVTFTESTFETNGNYNMELTVLMDGQPTQTMSQTYTDVTGFGTYTTDGNTMTTDGTFFDFNFDGVDMSEFGGPQTAQYSFSNGGQTLTMTQDTQEVETNNGAETITIVNSTTVLNRL
ncbi:hypothetical protein [Mangrovimonas spongiae]|uniref:Lipocalin-like domain-containing protein n=1 Tax=Mangrovimonas spongiae TaxID=2494697 RepID=A0A3R9N3M6_9FLAO|nr:hypothetical protein [Mangrovimonas spongiae]RSK38225.1 hypothetical protein EJA19_12055 [Mangrovimonas spongiae]